LAKKSFSPLGRLALSYLLLVELFDSILSLTFSCPEGRGFPSGAFVLTRLSAALMLVLGCLLIAMPPFAPRTITSNSDVAHLSTIYLVFACASEPFLELAITLTNSIRGLATPWFQWPLTPRFY